MAISFSTKTDYAVSTRPSSVAIADINGDGFLDIATTSDIFGSDNYASILLGKGDGTFKPYLTAALGSAPRDIELVDVNKDDKLDILAANNGANSVSILLGKGNALFDAAITESVGVSPVSIATGYINKDDKLDIVIANEDVNSATGTISILIGKGDGTFTSTANLNAGISPTFIDLADLNHDGKLDIVATNRYSGTLTFLGNANGSFASPTVNSSLTNPIFVMLGDVNADNNVDAVISDYSSKVNVLFGDGTGLFPNTISVSDVALSSDVGDINSIALGDINGDGNEDIVAAKLSDNVVVVLTGTSDGFFDPVITQAVGDAPFDVALADIDKDGSLDIVTANLSSASVSVLLNNGSGIVITSDDLTTGENGDTATLNVSLKTKPLSDVKIIFSSPDSSQGTIKNSSTLTFTTANWSKPQTLTVAGVDNSTHGDNPNYFINISITTLDQSYKSLNVNDLQRTLSNTNDDDVIYGDAGGVQKIDQLEGECGEDELYGLTMNDNLSGGDDDDTLWGGEGNDVLSGDDGDDVLYGESGNDTLFGGDGEDTLKGGEGVDSLVGGSDDDILDGGINDLAPDTLTGGEGDDTYYVYGTEDNIIDKGLEGADTIKMFQSGSYSLPAGIENGTINAKTLNAILTGNNLNNTLTGNDKANTLNGELGNDTLVAGDGDDAISAGGGNDVIIGGRGGGNDIINGGNGIDIVRYESAITSIKVNLKTGLANGAEIGADKLVSIENIIGGKAGDTLIGSNQNNQIDGFTGSDSITGGLGNDNLIGNIGNDKLNGEEGIDTLSGGVGKDIFQLTTISKDSITDFVVADDTIQLENSVFTKLVTTGVLNAANFKIGVAAVDSDDYLVYDSSSGILSYDADGNGAGIATPIAVLGLNLALTTADFVVI